MGNQCCGNPSEDKLYNEVVDVMGAARVRTNTGTSHAI